MVENKLKKTFNGKNVLITGNTGFKGTWLSIWLKHFGANVIGYGLEPPTVPNNFTISRINEKIEYFYGDVRNYSDLEKTIKMYKPDFIFHLAAQPIVLKSFEDPVITLETNVMGTINVLEAIRRSKIKSTIICITSDKCYRNEEWIWGYKEGDHLGGEDPYSASKAMAEIAISSFRESFFNISNFAEHNIGLASVRAGNVIGGGDFAQYRLVPDMMKALIRNEKIKLRNPKSVRPWQHVLEPLSGYLWLASEIHNKKIEFAGAWNFGPDFSIVTSEEIVRKGIEYWGSGDYEIVEDLRQKREAGLLNLNCDKSKALLYWKPNFDWHKSVEATVKWFRAYTQNEDMYDFSIKQIIDYELEALSKKIIWATP